MISHQRLKRTTDYNQNSLHERPSAPVDRNSTRRPSAQPFTRGKVTGSLAYGSQAQMIQAAAFAELIGSPLNVFITINVDMMKRLGFGGIFEIGHTADNIKLFQERINKWTKTRHSLFAVIWSREYTAAPTNKSGHSGEHLHWAMHLGREHQSALITYLMDLLNVTKAYATNATEGELARSTCNTLHITHCTRGGRSGGSQAAYLGKDEPNRRRVYNKLRENTRKLVRGGYCASSGGPITGKRYGISTAINTKAQHDHRCPQFSASELTAYARGRSIRAISAAKRAAEASDK